MGEIFVEDDPEVPTCLLAPGAPEGFGNATPGVMGPRSEPESSGLCLDAEMTAMPTSAPPTSAPLVALVDDNDDNRAIYRQYLEWIGFRVVEATDGLQALEQAAALTPAAIVMDLRLPRLDGWEAMRRLKADPATKHIPVLALTAHALVGDAEQARAAGCDRYLTKPCLPEDLARAIRSVIKRPAAVGSRSVRSVRRRPAPVPGQGLAIGATVMSGARHARPT
jgi:CheY-like chemotaxis protein